MIVGVGAAALLGWTLGPSAQDRVPAPDPTAGPRLKLARKGLEAAQRRIAEVGGMDAALEQVPIWSLRIFEAQRETDAVEAARDHLARMKEYAKNVEFRFKLGEGSETSAIDGQFRELEAEALLSKSRAK